MRWTRLARNVLLGVSLLCLGLPEADALEIFAPPGVATHMDDGLITQVRGGARRGGGGMHRGGGGMHRGGGGMHRGGGGMHRGGGAYRGGGRLPWGEPIAAALIVGGPTVAALIVAGRIEAGPTVAGRIVEAHTEAAPTVPAGFIAMAVGPVPGTAGRLAAQSQPARRWALSAPRRPRPGRAPLRGLACAGTTPTPAAGRASGTPASKALGLRPA